MLTSFQDQQEVPKNNGDSLLYGTEKSLKEVGDKVDELTKKNVESAIENLKKTLKNDDLDAIISSTEALTTASHKLTEMLYAQNQQANPDSAAQSGNTAKDSEDDDVVDADFEEVNKEDK